MLASDALLLQPLLLLLPHPTRLPQHCPSLSRDLATAGNGVVSALLLLRLRDSRGRHAGHGWDVTAAAILVGVQPLLTLLRRTPAQQTA